MRASLNVFNGLFNRGAGGRNVLVDLATIAQINTLVYTSPFVLSAEQYLLAKTFSKGFVVELNSGGPKTTIADSSKRPQDYAEWKRLAIEIYCQCVRYGFATVQKFEEDKQLPRVLDACNYQLGFTLATDTDQPIYTAYSLYRK